MLACTPPMLKPHMPAGKHSKLAQGLLCADPTLQCTDLLLERLTLSPKPCCSARHLKQCGRYC